MSVSGAGESSAELEDMLVEEDESGDSFSETPSPASDVSNPGQPGVKRRIAKSVVWEHYEASGDGKHYICNYCPTKLSSSNSTTTLQRHLKSGHPEKLKPTNKPGIPRWAHPKPPAAEKVLPSVGQKILEEKFRRLVIASNLPLSIADQSEFVDFMHYAIPEFKLISRNTLKAAILNDYAKTKAVMKVVLYDAPGRLSLTLDLWTSKQQVGYLTVTVHWIDKDWTLRSATLDFSSNLPASHTGKNVMNALLECLLEFEIAHRVLGVSGDGAMRKCHELIQPKLKIERVRHGKSSDVSDFVVWCLCHCVNLVAGAGLKKQANSVNAVHNQILTVKRPKAKKEFLEILKEKNLKLPTDVRTRWNSTLHMLEGAYERREKLGRFIEVQEGAVSTTVLKGEAWNEIHETIKLLKPLDDATNDCSADTVPTIHLAVGTIETLREHLTEVMDGISWAPSVRHMAKDMKTKLDTMIQKDKTWPHDMYLLAALLDPGMKKAGIPVDKVDHAVSVLKRVFGEYATQHRTPEENCTRDEAPGCPGLTGTSVLRAKRMKTMLQSSEPVDEIANYLRELPCGDMEVLAWWKANSVKYPVLSKIARDFLAVQLSSAASEREFSKARSVITDLRNRLGFQSARALMCLKSWKSFSASTKSTVSDAISVE